MPLPPLDSWRIGRFLVPEHIHSMDTSCWNNVTEQVNFLRSWMVSDGMEVIGTSDYFNSVSVKERCAPLYGLITKENGEGDIFFRGFKLCE